MGYKHVNNTRHEFLPVKQVSNPIKGTVGYLINCLATVAPVGIYYLAGHYYYMQCLLLDKTTKTFPIPGACILLCSTKTSQQGDVPDQFKMDFPPHPTMRIS